jgi:hypothetical protein
MTDQAGEFGELAMNLHNHSDVLGAVDGVLQFAVEVLHYDHASVLLINVNTLKPWLRPTN